jgi:hypothetical protein
MRRTPGRRRYDRSAQDRAAQDRKNLAASNARYDACGAAFVNDESLTMMPPRLHETTRAYGYTIELTGDALRRFFSLERIRKPRP